MTRLTDERIAEIEARLVSYDFKDSIGHPLVTCKDFQDVLAEVKLLRTELAQAEAERYVLAEQLYEFAAIFPICNQCPAPCSESDCTNDWLKYAQQQAEKQEA